MSEYEAPNEILQEFLVESYEGLDHMEQDLLDLDEGGGREKLASLFRAIHTLKGTSGFLGMGRIEKLAHVGENLLSALRDGNLEPRQDLTDLLLKMSDALRTMLQQVEATGEEPDDDQEELRQALEAALTGEPPAAAPKSGPAPAAPAASAHPASPPPAPEPSVAPSRSPSRAPNARFSSRPSARPAKISVVPKPAAKPAAKADKPASGEGGGSKLSEGNVRVTVDLLDRLMNLVGELVLVRNQILQHSARVEDAALGAASQQLNLVTTELQEGVMKTRMQPIASVWNKFPRVVRDLSRVCGKQAHVDFQGRETELDRTIIEAIKDPMTHLLRNSMDHGLEDPHERVAAGKPEVGTLTLRAFHEGGQVNIEMADDGKGIDVDRVKALAIERGLISESEASSMSDRDAYLLIFRPGFSTAKEVTNISGRGVGLDVVKTNIERIGGMIDVSSARGVGTTFKLKIPLTLAIIPALIVRCEGDRFAIPQVSLLELVRLEGEERRRIETIRGTPLLRLRGKLLPLVHLRESLDLKSEEEADAYDIVVVQADERQFGLVVDHTHDTEEIVVKPLGKELKNISAFAGATIMGDGKVALILDILGIAQRAGLLDSNNDAVVPHEQARKANRRGGDHRELLLVDGVENRVFALPLEKVDRLESVEPERVELVGSHRVVRYGDSLLPLVDLCSVLLPGRSADDHGALHVSVCVVNGRTAGLIAGPFLDVITDDDVVIDRLTRRHGVEGTAIINDQVLEVVDTEAIIDQLLGPAGTRDETYAAAAE